jgi:hypothetical protein
MLSRERNSQLVDDKTICVFCRRGPRNGERYGTKPLDWDFANICPECWIRVCGEAEDDAGV